MRILCGIAILGAASVAGAQARDGEINVTILDVGYNSAYRNGTWVPVDVIVENEKGDITGYVEVRTYWVTGELQSPIYHVPVESPNHSRKRFRAHCMLRDTDRVEATLYHQGRRVVEVPSWINVKPIRPTDSLVLVLDKISANFSFLTSVLQDVSGGRGVYRRELDTERLSYLPSYEPCYGAFDFIIMSQIDPTRLSVRHKELLRQYVQSGGVLVACIGEDANIYRGSWLEDLLGVRIGESQLVTEPEYARLVFPPDRAVGAKEGRQYSVATLEPVLPEVLVRGESLVLATMRKIGSGAAVGLAVDGASFALQETQGFHELWRDLAAMRGARSDLNYAAAAQVVGQQLPWISGVRIQPRSTVMAYLGLYFLVGIVGNWLFWNRLKRREMAWACLVIFSLGFTAYAVTFGTLGRAKNSEISRIDVVETPLAGETADLHSLAGILTAGTSFYSGKLVNEYALVTEAYQSNFQQGFRPRGMTMGGMTPFTFVEGSTPRIENMRVGASELRLLHIEDQIAVAGTVEGTLHYDSSGIHGTLRNRTGFRADAVYLYYAGNLYSLSAAEDEWTAAITPAMLEQGTAQGFSDILEQHRRSGGTWLYPHAGASTQQFADTIMLSLLMHPDQMGNMMPDMTRGPFVMAWVQRPSLESLKLDLPIPERIRETLLIADVVVEKSSTAGASSLRLPTQADYWQSNPNLRLAGNPAYQLRSNTHHNLYVTAPAIPYKSNSKLNPITLHVFWDSEGADLTVFAMDPDTSQFVELKGTAAQEFGANVRGATYELRDWARYCAPGTNQIHLSVYAAEPTGFDRVNSYFVGTFSVRAETRRDAAQQQHLGAWKSWPLSKPSS